MVGTIDTMVTRPRMAEAAASGLNPSWSSTEPPANADLTRIERPAT